jgi:type III secretion system YopN/LcrE/InvE/MxiC family regulator
MITPISPRGSGSSRLLEELHAGTRAKASGTVSGSAAAADQASAVDFANAVEELAVGVAARTVTRLHEGPHRHPMGRIGRDLRSLRQIYRIGRLRGLHAAFEDAFWRDEVVAPADELISQARQGGDVKRLADFQAADPFKRYVFLLEAEVRARTESEPNLDVQKRLASALKQVWVEHEKQIQAGFNAAQPLARLSEHEQEWNEFRRVYFNCFVHHGTLAQTFKSLREKFEPERFRESIKTMRDALAADLASPAVLADRVRMEQQQRDLENNRTIWSLASDAEKFLHGLSGKHVPDQRVLDFVGEVLDYATGPANERKLNGICALVPDAEPTEHLRWQVKNFMKHKLLLSVWSSLEAHDTLFPPSFLRSRL